MNASSTENLIAGVIILCLSGLGAMIHKKQSIGFIITLILTIVLFIFMLMKLMFYFGQMSMSNKIKYALDRQVFTNGKSIEIQKFTNTVIDKLVNKQTDIFSENIDYYIVLFGCLVSLLLYSSFKALYYVFRETIKPVNKFHEKD